MAIIQSVTPDRYRDPTQAGAAQAAASFDAQVHDKSVSHRKARARADQTQARNGTNGVSGKHPLRTMMVIHASSQVRWARPCRAATQDPCGMAADPRQPAWPHGDGGNAQAVLP